MMHKRMLALALAGLCSASQAFADDAVNIYGRLAVGLENTKGDDATPAATLPSNTVGVPPTGLNGGYRARVTSYSSYLGFRGTEDLGDNLKAFFQIETGIAVDTGGGSFPTRNTGVGLISPWGAVTLGNWDTPYLISNIKIDPFYAILPSSIRAIVNNPGFGNAAGPTVQSTRVGTLADASFDRRQGNSIIYVSPNINGAFARVQYSTSEGKGPAGSPPVTISPWIGSVSLNYDQGPVYVSLVHERHSDYFGLTGMGIGGAPSTNNPSSTDQGSKIVVGYTFFGSTSVGAVYDHLAYKNNDGTPGNVNKYRRNAWALTLKQPVGQGTIRAGYAKALDGKCSRTGGGDCIADQTGATQWSVGYSHTLSKRTDAYALYTRLKNDAYQAYQQAVGTALPQAPGSTSPLVGVGLIHSF